MATIRAISLRLKSVKNIQKITKSMKMVSAAKYARAERELKAARPIGENMQKFYRLEKTEKSKKDGEKPRRVLYVAVTSDRGLCGAVHTSIARHIRNSLGKGEDSKIICLGDKARSALQKQYAEHFLFVCNEVGRLPPTFLDACRVTNAILKSEYEFDLGKIVFNKYRSVVSYSTSEILLHNLTTLIESDKIRNYEDANEETVISVMEFSMAGLLFYAMKEGAASEQSSRMTAMDNASKNAGDMIDQLTLKFNRTRQAVITKELIEIISGASALKS